MGSEVLPAVSYITDFLLIPSTTPVLNELEEASRAVLPMVSYSRDLLLKS